MLLGFDFGVTVGYIAYMNKQGNDKATEADMESKAKALAKRAALGTFTTVRTGKNSTMSGTIKAVEFNRIKQLRDGRTQAIFNMTLVCGTAQIERTFTVAGFPGRS